MPISVDLIESADQEARIFLASRLHDEDIAAFIEWQKGDKKFKTIYLGPLKKRGSNNDDQA